MKNIIIFTFVKKALTQKRSTAVGTKSAPSYRILFVAKLEEEIIKESECKPYKCTLTTFFSNGNMVRIN